jgi:predicted trehalose synthase
MASTSPARIDDELYASAKASGAVMSRSASQQVSHWARIGRELEAAGSVSSREVARVLAGQGEYDALGSRAQATVRAEWRERMADRLAGLDLATEFESAGQSYAELDDEGRAVRRQSPPGV